MDRPALLSPLSRSGNKQLPLDRLIEQAEAVRRRTGSPVILALALDMERIEQATMDVRYCDYTILTPGSIARFKVSTRKLARLRRRRI